MGVMGFVCEIMLMTKIRVRVRTHGTHPAHCESAACLIH
jgi:hypothetical protein